MDNKAILKAFADNQPLFYEVKKVIEEVFKTEEVNMQDSDEVIGQMTRARIDGMRRVEKAFKEIEKYKTPDLRNSEMMPAR